MVAVLSLLALFLTGILTSQQALAGFADSTTLMVAALFIVGEGLARTGITARLGQFLMQQAGNSEPRLLVVLMIGTALLSGFMSNTGTVAMLLPAIVAASWRIGSLPSRFLIPLAFAANVGGLMTLIGTAPNIVVSDTLAARERAALASSSLPCWAFRSVLAAVCSWRWLAGACCQAADGRQAAGPGGHGRGHGPILPPAQQAFRLRVRVSSPLVGKTLAEAAFGRDYGVTVLVIDLTPAESGRSTPPPAAAGQSADRTLAEQRRRCQAPTP